MLIVSLRVGDYNMHRVLVDNGSSADILYYPVFQQMRIDKEQPGPDKCPSRWFQRDKSVLPWRRHVVSNGMRLPPVDH